MTQTERKTLQQFVAENKITAKVATAASNPHMPDLSRHFKVTLYHDGSQMTVPFSQGSAYRDDPTAEDVLSCLSSDAASVEQSSFEEWARDMGYDEDSRKAEKIYNACEKLASKLSQFLGEDLYQELLYHTEPL